MDNDEGYFPQDNLLLNRFEVVTTSMVQLIESLFETEKHIFDVKNEGQDLDPQVKTMFSALSSPHVSKYLRLQSLFSLLHRTITFYSPSDDEILALAATIQDSRNRTQEGLKDYLRQTMAAVEEEDQDVIVPEPKTRKKRTDLN